MGSEMCIRDSLNTKGRNPEEVPVELVKFLKFVSADLRESEQDFED